MGDDVGVSARPLGRTDFGTILEGYVTSLNRTHKKFFSNMNNRKAVIFQKIKFYEKLTTLISRHG